MCIRDSAGDVADVCVRRAGRSADDWRGHCPADNLAAGLYDSGGQLAGGAGVGADGGKYYLVAMWFDVCVDAWRYVVDEEADEVRSHPGEYRGVVYNLSLIHI